MANSIITHSTGVKQSISQFAARANGQALAGPHAGAARLADPSQRSTRQMGCGTISFPMANHRFLAFDIETAKVLPVDVTNWWEHRPLGICCAATWSRDAGEPSLWHGTSDDGRPAACMSRRDLQPLVEFLQRMTASGYTVVTWNGLGFDFQVLAEESSMTSECKSIARRHVDLMFHVFCLLGHPLSLDAAAQGMGLAGKPEGMSGLLAPQLWADGQHERVLQYVAQDVRATLDLAEACQQKRRLNWISRAGQVKYVDLPDGLLTVDEANALPRPDTSWMSQPMPRERFTGWLD